MKILFMGRKSVAAEALAWLVQHPGVEVVGVLTDHHMPVSPTADQAREFGLPLFTLEQVEQRLAGQQLQFDLGLSMLYWRRIPSAFLTVPACGIINFHPAPLPDYKGTGGYNMAVLQGLNEWAVSAHYVDSDIDTGNIIEVERFPIDPENETARSLEASCRTKLSTLFTRIVSQVLHTRGRLPSYPNVGGRYIKRTEMEAMKRLSPGDDIDRKVRAFWFPPYDGAYIELDDQRYTLVNRRILNQLADPTASNLFQEEKQ